MNSIVLLILGCVSQIYAQTTAGPCAGQPYGCYVPDPTSCEWYYQCVSNDGFRRPCPPGLEFNAKLSVCDWPARANCSGGGGGGGGEVTPNPGGPTPPCTSTNAATLPYPNDCGKYYYCYKGYPYVVQCKANEMYSQPDNSCIASTTCGGGGEVTPNPGGPQAPCTSTQPATLPYPNDCGKYYYCYQGYPYTVVCNAGEYYSASVNSCIKANSCPSGGGGTGGGGGGGGGTGGFTCPQQFGTYPYPGDVTKYYYCYESAAYIVQCFTNQHYDQSINACQTN